MNTNILRKAIVDQGGDITGLFKRERIMGREMKEEVKDTIDSKTIMVVSGIRRAVKSLFSLQLLEDKGVWYVNFDGELPADIRTRGRINPGLLRYEQF